jgi:hypothetical protein
MNKFQVNFVNLNIKCNYMVNYFYFFLERILWSSQKKKKKNWEFFLQIVFFNRFD